MRSTKNHHGMPRPFGPAVEGQEWLAGIARRAGGHHHHGPRGGWGPGGGRGRRGDVRAAILALLAERPMHGYEMLQEIGDRTGEFWRPSPGSLYPALQLLEDQGFIRAVDDSDSGRRRFELTDEGRAEQERQAPTGTPWEALVKGVDPAAFRLRSAVRQVAVATQQVVWAGDKRQKADAERLLTNLRRQLYRLLAEEPADEPADAEPGDAADAG